MQPASDYRRNAGFTTIELLVVLVIAAILAAIAGPSFMDFINNTRMTSAMSQLTGDLNLARSEAIKRNMRVLVCVRNAAGADCGTGTDWRNGWLVCYDGDQDGSCDAATADAPNPLVVRQALNASMALTANANLIRFNPSGTQGAGGAATLTLAGTWAGAQLSIASIAATGNISRQ
ncbi:MAG: GspH/FimT family pseudopilin [Nitrosomonadales bacterium]|nr:GspH/FimT family pseudopilin [Nitrosomonadales bacterium]